MGAVGGGIWHFSKGMYHSPRGLSSRFAGGVSVRARSRDARRTRPAVACAPRRCVRCPRRCAARLAATNPRFAECLLARRRCASRRPASVAASPCGAASSQPSTARWWPCARRCARGGAARARHSPRTGRATAACGATLTRRPTRRRTPGTPSAPARSQEAFSRCALPSAACTHDTRTLLSATLSRACSRARPQLRHGLASAGRSAAFGGILLAGIEGIGILITRMTAPPPPPGLDEMAVGMGMAGAGGPGAAGGMVAASAPAPAPEGPLGPGPAASAGGGGDAAGGGSGGGGWFGGMFGGSSRKAGQSTGGSEAPPMPDFGAPSGGSGGGIKFE